jgi:pimeloyl-ACP methyl ester carboxylesterase
MFLSVAGRRLEARRIVGPPPEVVFLHEGLGSVGLWRDFPDRVCEASGRGGLLYSRGGYGASDPVPLPRPLTYLDDEAALVEAVVDAAGIDEAVLVGHSDGASIALGAAIADARRHPEGEGRILGVAALSPHAFVEADKVRAIRDTGARYRDTDLRERLSRHHARVDVAFRGWHDAWTNPAFAAWSLVDDLGAIRVPVLVVQGETDPYGSLEQARRIAHGVAGPAEVVVFPACGHDPHRDHPEETLAAVARLVVEATRPR